MKTKFLGFFALTIALILGASLRAEVVNITSITYTGTAGETFTDENNLINGTGLSAALTEANIDSVTHASAGDTNAWTTTDPGGFPSDFFASTSDTVSFELLFDDAYNLTDFYNWSYHFGGLNGNNIREVTIDYGVGDFASSTGPLLLSTPAAFNRASNAALVITADRVRITVTDNFFGVAGFGGGDRVSAAEFAFLGTAVSDDPILTTPDEYSVINNGATETIQVTLTNDGVAQTLNVTDVRVTGTNAAGFTVLTDFTSPLPIAPGGGTALIDIQVDPSNLPSPGVAFSGTFLEIDSNDTISPPTRSVPITGSVRDPWIDTVASVDLGTVLSSAGVQNFTLEVQNLGISALTIDDGFFNTGTSFSIVDDLVATPLVVPAGESGLVNLSLDPSTAIGAVNDTLELSSDDPVSGSPSIAYTVTIERDPVLSATEVELTSTSLDPQSFLVEISNTGASADLVISSASFTAGDVANFGVTGFDSPIATAASGDVTISFDPSGSYGTYSATLTVDSNDPVEPSADIQVIVTITPADANPVSPVAVDDTAANSFANATYAAANLINGSFVATLGDAPGGAENWVSESSGTDYFDAGTPPVLVFDMGSDIDLRLLYLWAYSEGTTFVGDRQANSAREFSLRFATATDGPTGFGTTITENPSFTGIPARPTVVSGGASDQPVQVYDFGTTVTARYVELTLSDNFFGFSENDGGDRVGLNEIAFDGLNGTASPFDTWISNYPSLTGSDALPGADPDGDGIDNEGEFGFDGNPDDGSDNGKVFAVIADGDDTADTADELILTVAMRTGAVFPASGAPLVSSAVDGIVYQVEGSIDLATFATQVNLEATAVGTAGLPAPSSGWEYRSFSLEGSNGLTDKGFIRAAVSSEN
jgi:hypothetical protein